MRRRQGGYIDDYDGPCNKNNQNKKTNSYIKESGKYSLEEMYMAFMEEGGLSVPEDAQIGQTKLLPGVGRSPSFRCVSSSENKSESSVIFTDMDNVLKWSHLGSGSRWAGKVRKRNIQTRRSQRGVPTGVHGKEYPPGAFIISIVNYGAV